MKLEIRIENNEPIIFFTDDLDHGKMIICYSRIGQHATASRGYMRTLAKPETKEQMIKAWLLIEEYANHAIYTLQL
jgi:hypothetical protein